MIEIGDEVYHKYDIFKDTLIVTEAFWWLGQRKLVCIAKNKIIGKSKTYYKDYEHYFVKVNNKVTLKERVGAGKKVKFNYYSQGELWYTCEDGFEFPVPIEDTSNGVFKSEDKAILFMRYVRKHMEMLDEARKEFITK